MSHPNPSTALASAVVDELAASGVGVVVLSPGSRSGALAIAADAHPDLDARVVIDERSAAFHALGVAKASRHPVAVVSTSGSAPANFLPAVVEADLSCAPLVVISADRPAELHGVGANQAIDQIGLFGNKVRSFDHIEAPGSSEDLNLSWRIVIRSAVGAAVGDRPGPVHINVAFREPTVPVTDDGRARGEVYPYDTPRLGPDGAPPAGSETLAPVLSAERGLVIAGDGEYERDRLLAEAGRIGWPVLATATSGLRGNDVVSTYHHLLGDGVPDGLRPTTVVAVGAIGPSPTLDTLVAAGQSRVRVDRWGRVIDPGNNATHRVNGDPLAVLAQVVGSADPSWARAWKVADQESRERLDDIIEGCEAMTGAGVAAVLNQVAWGALVVASSLPIREVDAHLNRGGPVFANRGASGIDGFVSTAFGVASVHPRTLALCGDLSFLHDDNGFLHDCPIDLTMVVVDNDGGGLFDSLPQAMHAPGYERLFVTPPDRDLVALARFHGAKSVRVENPGTLRDELGVALDDGGWNVLVVPVDRMVDLGVRAQMA